MKNPKMKLTLVPSDKMSENGEHSVVRLSRSSRDYYSPIGKSIEVTSNGEPLLLKIKQAAIEDIRTTKKLGLDIGNIGFVSRKTYNVITGAKENGEAWISESIDGLQIGSDPEFGLIDDEDDFVYAERVCKHGNKTTPIGHDGPCMELRPKHSNKIDEHVENIKSLLVKANTFDDINNYRWWTGATYKSKNVNKDPRKYTIGGHIHIGNPSILTEFVYSDENSNKKQPIGEHAIQRRILRVLDELVGIPLSCVDGPDPGYRRKKNYGFPGDFREQTGRMEWRTPSAIWLTNPLFTRSILGTVKAVSEECYRRIVDRGMSQNFVYHSQNTKGSMLASFNCVPDKLIIDILVEEKECDSGVLNNIFKTLKSMSTYSKYKEYIDEFIKLTNSREKFLKKTNLYKIREYWE